MTDPNGATPEEARDLTQIGTGAAGELPDAEGYSPQRDRVKLEPYDPIKERENVRGKIAMWLIWTFVGLIALVALIALATQVFCSLNGATCPEPTTKLDTIRTLVELILTPLVGLVGAVSGFYFGEKAGNPGGSA